jgi:hypothetical protein
MHRRCLNPARPKGAAPRGMPAQVLAVADEAVAEEEEQAAALT